MRLKLFRTFLALLIAAAFYSCSSSRSTESSVASHSVTIGQYSFTIWDTKEFKVMAGMLTIDSVSSGNVYGSYSRSMLYDSTFSNVRMLSGGSFTGKYNSEKSDITLNMNPNVADNNIYLTGKTYNTYIVGDWRQSTMTEFKKQGKFRAELK